MPSASPQRSRLPGFCLTLTLATLLGVPIAPARAQAPVPPAALVKIQVHIVSATNGHAIRSRELAFVLGVDTDRPVGITDPHGNIVIKVDPSTTIRLITQPGADCRPAKPDPTTIKYSIAEILAHGIVTENVCGKGHAEPRPGQLTLFEPPRGKLGFLFGGFSY